ncbi:uncharacterized protein V6R79_026093 [Siganus canaliculatus]
MQSLSVPEHHLPDWALNLTALAFMAESCSNVGAGSLSAVVSKRRDPCCSQTQCSGDFTVTFYFHQEEQTDLKTLQQRQSFAHAHYCSGKMHDSL